MRVFSRRAALAALGMCAVGVRVSAQVPRLEITCEAAFGRPVAGNDVEVLVFGTSPNELEYFEEPLAYLEASGSVALRKTNAPGGRMCVLYRANRLSPVAGLDAPDQARVFALDFSDVWRRLVIRNDEARLFDVNGQSITIRAIRMPAGRLWVAPGYLYTGGFRRVDRFESVFVNAAQDANRYLPATRQVASTRMPPWDADVLLYTPFTRNATGPNDIDATCLEAGYWPLLFVIRDVRLPASLARGDWLYHTHVSPMLDPGVGMRDVWASLTEAQRRRYTVPTQFERGHSYTIVIWFRPGDANAPTKIPNDSYFVMKLVDPKLQPYRPLLFSNTTGLARSFMSLPAANT